MITVDCSFGVVNIFFDQNKITVLIFRCKYKNKPLPSLLLLVAVLRCYGHSSLILPSVNVNLDIRFDCNLCKVGGGNSIKIRLFVVGKMPVTVELFYNVLLLVHDT